MDIIRHEAVRMNCKLMLDRALSKLHQHAFDDGVPAKGIATVESANPEKISPEADVRGSILGLYQLARHAWSQAGRMPVPADPRAAVPR